MCIEHRERSQQKVVNASNAHLHGHMRFFSFFFLWPYCFLVRSHTSLSLFRLAASCILLCVLPCVLRCVFPRSFLFSLFYRASLGLHYYYFWCVSFPICLLPSRIFFPVIISISIVDAISTFIHTTMIANVRKGSFIIHKRGYT